MNRNVRRMAWYMRKVNAYNRARFDLLRGRTDRVPPSNRPARLLAYKLAMNERLRAGRSVPTC
ncbi:hypothetical protein DQG23_21215 [Paenibacillus contaminans]|uniref:Uncharacterized protein n=1 Tax=Paenibacillus contaminans TaxID=450362 RepID=A0A329MI56_9BACL|nr:hypothetical protein DQG23_21215 [Paenibacillus contaminans]